jgi:hypothetical protein
VVREVGGMNRNAIREDKRLPVLGLDTDIRFASQTDRAAFAKDLTAVVAQLVSKYHDAGAPDGRWQRLVVTAHPVPKDVDPSPPPEAESSSQHRPRQRRSDEH